MKKRTGKSGSMKKPMKTKPKKTQKNYNGKKGVLGENTGLKVGAIVLGIAVIVFLGLLIGGLLGGGSSSPTASPTGTPSPSLSP